MLAGSALRTAMRLSGRTLGYLIWCTQRNVCHYTPGPLTPTHQKKQQHFKPRHRAHLCRICGDDCRRPILAQGQEPKLTFYLFWMRFKLLLVKAVVLVCILWLAVVIFLQYLAVWFYWLARGICKLSRDTEILTVDW